MSNKESVGKKEHAFLMAENRELRNLWIENEGDIIELKCIFTRYLALKWYQRLFVNWHDWRLHYDVRPSKEANLDKEETP